MFVCNKIMRGTYIFVSAACVTAACDFTMNTLRNKSHSRKVRNKKQITKTLTKWPLRGLSGMLAARRLHLTCACNPHCLHAVLDSEEDIVRALVHFHESLLRAPRRTIGKTQHTVLCCLLCHFPGRGVHYVAVFSFMTQTA